jgi:hypothetical protein
MYQSKGTIKSNHSKPSVIVATMKNMAEVKIFTFFHLHTGLVVFNYF